jgi:ketosteroid isomerase-like protein
MDHPVVQQFADAWSRHDARALQALMTPDGRYEVVPQGRVFGPETLPEQVSFMESLSSDFAVKLVSSLVEGERCAVEFELWGINDGPFRPFRLEPSGRPFKVRGMWLLVLEDGLIALCRAYWDLAGLLSQIGLAPPGEIGWQLANWADEREESVDPGPGSLSGAP